MKKIIIFILLLVSVLATLDDKLFVEKYKIRINNRGTYPEYPKKGDNVKVHYTVSEKQYMLGQIIGWKEI